MNLLNRDTDYAVRALCHMAHHPEATCSAAALQPLLHVPPAFLRRILQQLARGGVLESTRGKGGGFRLARPAAAIRLTEVIALFQGTVNLVECVFRGKTCPDCNTCPLRRTLKEIESDALAKLGATTIATLAGE